MIVSNIKDYFNTGFYKKEIIKKNLFDYSFFKTPATTKVALKTAIDNLSKVISTYIDFTAPKEFSERCNDFSCFDKNIGLVVDYFNKHCVPNWSNNYPFCYDYVKNNTMVYYQNNFYVPNLYPKNIVLASASDVLKNLYNEFQFKHQQPHQFSATLNNIKSYLKQILKLKIDKVVDVSTLKVGKDYQNAFQ